MRPEDLQALREAIRRISPVADDALSAALPDAHVRELARSQHLLRAHEPATQVAFVTRGLLREYFGLPNGTERTKAFVVEHQVSGSLADLIARGPSTANIVAEEPTRVVCIPYPRLVELAAHWEPWARFGRRATELVLLRKAERERELLGMDADARYRRFEDAHPQLAGRVAAKHIASYLGITPVHLSRLRRQRRERRRSTR